MRAQFLPVLCPSIEMVLHGDGSTDSLGPSDGPELLEGRRAYDTRLVGTSGLQDVVGAAV